MTNFGILGTQGCGKTLALTFLAALYKRHGYTVLSNYKLEFADEFLATPNDIFSEPIPYPSFLALDEFYRWCYSFYAWHSMNKLMSDFMAEARKRGFQFGITGIRFMDLDPRIRALISTWIFPKRLNKDYFGLSIFLEDVFNLRFVKRVSLYAPAIWGKYDTRFIITPYEYTKTIGEDGENVMMESSGGTIQQLQAPRAIPDGHTALAQGILLQKQIVEELQLKGLNVVSSYERGRPDIVVYGDGGEVREVVAVKGYTLTPTTEQGMRNVKGLKVAHTFVADRDAIAEVNYAKEQGLNQIRLKAVNLTTNNRLYDELVDFDVPITLRDFSEAMALQGYATPSGTTIPDIYPAKLKQRTEVAEMLQQDTVLELFAGKGTLSSLVYAKRVKRLILVDKETEYLEIAKRRLQGAVCETYAMDNVRWIREVLPARLGELEENLTLVDFDDFGMPGETIQEFFKTFHVKKPLVVAITDGGNIKLGFISKDVQSLMKRMYGLQDEGYTREDIIIFIDQLMDNIARQQNCIAKRINVAYNPQKSACYTGYLLTP